MTVTIRIVMTSAGPLVAARINQAPSAQDQAVADAKRRHVIEVES